MDLMKGCQICNQRDLQEMHLGRKIAQRAWTGNAVRSTGQRARMKILSAGVLVTDGTRLLLGHATRSPRWDIPKGIVQEKEDVAEAAARELHEETGLRVEPTRLIPLGVHRYLPGKDLALFEWRLPSMPDLSSLHCDSHFTVGESLLPEFDRFGIFDWDEATTRVGRNMARVLSCFGPKFDTNQCRNL
ncbi:MAG TPA: NUDIX hydrolase [Rhodopila sp.]|uniref:NUDIX hydrolase n=1 Tax=Rhodopila sp. TaxID=2480087 RepID=UPI002D0A6FD0|nr:NUDIX hydrolase [Rhodopila sp.]HVY14117.1 NUDIX hydrolase [Rhodopila sp.]